MKTFLVCTLLIFSKIGQSQIVMESNGSMEKKVKSDTDKMRFGVSAQVATPDLPVFQLIFSVTAYHKNKQLSAGPIVHFNQYELPTNVVRKQYGYNLTYRYTFPQNKGIAKAFIPLEFEHSIKMGERTSYYNHLLSDDGPGNTTNPGYSFNLNTRSKSHHFSLRSGLGLYVWLHDNFNVQLQATVGPNFWMGKEEYINIDTNDIVGSEIFKLSSDKYSVSFSAGFGFRF